MIHSLTLRLRRAWIIWQLHRLERRIDPDHFHPALSRKIDRCIYMLEKIPPSSDAEEAA